MKKNLLYLLALVCSLTFFAACSSDDEFLRGDRLVPVLDEYTYDGDLVGSLAVIFAGLYHRIALHGIDD